MKNLHTAPFLAFELPELDELRAQLYPALARLQHVDKDGLPSACGDVIGLIESLCRHEEEWMERIDFPDMKAHREAHAHMLSVLHHAHSLAWQGQACAVRDILGCQFATAFLMHTNRMDAALARALPAHSPV